MSILIGFILGGLVIYFFIYRKKLKRLQQLDTETIEKNKSLKAECLQLTRTKNELIDEMTVAEVDLANLKSHISDTKSHYNQLEEFQVQLLQEKIANEAERLNQQAENNREEYKNQILSVQQDCIKAYKAEVENWTNKISKLKDTYSDLKKVVDAATESNIRNYEKKQKEKFYQLDIPEEDLQEIAKLREVGKTLRDSEPLNKVIWKVYYEKAYTDLIGRVLGKEKHTGIYKITNLTNRMCYVGQAVDVAERWKQHLRRGMGAETPTRNKLYPAMLATGIENFSFELIEECAREQLNEREQFWQAHFKAKEFGYSIK